MPININTTCPNRDGCIDNKGCIFCGEEGAGFEILPSEIPVEDQLNINMQYIGKKYKVNKFIAYFQNYSNTYIDLDSFKVLIEQACIKDIVAIYISTRPDCINDLYLEFLRKINIEKNVAIVIELGLQTVNYHTLKVLNRGHTLAEFIDAVMRIKSYKLDVCAHLIIDLPMDNIIDVIEAAKILSALKVEQVKLHSLYILKDTVLGDMYEKGIFKPVDIDEYKNRVKTFLEYLSDDIIIQRIIGRASKERTLFCTWNTSWRKIQDDIEREMEAEGRYQGKIFNYLNGKAMKKYI